MYGVTKLVQGFLLVVNLCALKQGRWMILHDFCGSSRFLCFWGVCFLLKSFIFRVLCQRVCSVFRKDSYVQHDDELRMYGITKLVQGFLLDVNLCALKHGRWMMVQDFWGIVQELCVSGEVIFFCKSPLFLKFYIRKSSVLFFAKTHILWLKNYWCYGRWLPQILVLLAALICMHMILSTGAWESQS